MGSELQVRCHCVSREHRNVLRHTGLMQWESSLALARLLISCPSLVSGGCSRHILNISCDIQKQPLALCKSFRVFIWSERPVSLALAVLPRSRDVVCSWAPSVCLIPHSGAHRAQPAWNASLLICQDQLSGHARLLRRLAVPTPHMRSTGWLCFWTLPVA